MAIVLGPNQYGKAENRVVRIYRDTDRHEIRDINVSTVAARRLHRRTPDRRPDVQVLPTDTQKQTVLRLRQGDRRSARSRTIALALGRHFVNDTAAGRGLPDRGRRVRLGAGQAVGGSAEHNHTWVRKGQETRTTILTIDGKGDAGTETLVSGLKDLVVLKSTGSEFHDFLGDEYTTLDPHQRPGHGHLAGRPLALHRHRRRLGRVLRGIRQIMLEQFAEVHSLALQQTLYEMGRAVLEAHDDVAEIKFSAPNKHHFVYDLSPFGLENPNEVFHADDRPYGLIQATRPARRCTAGRARLGHRSWLLLMRQTARGGQ